MQKEPVECEYLLEGRLCKAVAELPEVKSARKEFCRNNPKDYCCYLCSYRENCEIACSYLNRLPESTSIDSDLSSKVEQQIKKYEEEKVKLSLLFANAKIVEQSYLTATQALDGKIEELKKLKENHPLLEKNIADIHRTGEFEQEVPTEPTALWYLVPFFFGVIGGIIAYLGTKDEDKEMADSLLIFGIIWTIILVIAYFAILASIFSSIWRSF